MAILITGTTFFAGCLQQTAPVTQNIHVIMPFVASSEWMPVYAAINQGYYADEGLNLSVEYTSEGSFGAIKQVVAGNSQLGYASGCSVILARSQEIPVVSVYQVDHNDIYGIITKQSSGIKTPQGMVNKSIAYTAPGTPDDISIKAILTNSGVDYNKVQFIPVGGAALPTLLSNKTDAMSGHLLFEELLKQENVSFFSMQGKDYNANLVTDSLITSENFINTNPDTVKKFVRATDKGLKYAAANPEQAVDGYLKKFNPDAIKTRDFELSFWKRMVTEAIVPDQFIPGSFNQTQWAMTQDIMKKIGVIDKTTDITKAYTTKFLPN